MTAAGHLGTTTNVLLGELSRVDFDALAPHLERVSLPRGMVLAKADEPVRSVYFPEGGVASVVSILSNRQRTEVGIFGCEGVSCPGLILGVDQSPYETFMQIEGPSALRIGVEPYISALERSSTLREVLLRYVQTVMVQGAHSTSTNAHLRIEARLARWILMAHDRVPGDELLLTHEFMGLMIAADRSGVTVTLHILEGAGMIYFRRGRVIVRDRDALIDLAGDSYGVPEAEYRRLIAPFGK